MAIFQVRRYDLLPAHKFLLALNIPPTVQANGDLVLADEEVSLFDSLYNNREILKRVIKAFTTRSRTQPQDPDDPEDD